MAQAGLENLTRTVEQLERLLRDGALAEVRRLLSETLVSETADPNPDAVSINGGLAWLFDRIADATNDPGYRVKANGYGQAALLLDPDDALALAVLPDREIELVAHNLLRHRKSSIARRLLERLQARRPAAAQLLALMDFVAAEKRRIAETVTPPPGSAPPLLINAIVWGSAYIDALFTYGFPSLLAPGNLPAVASDREIVFDFYTLEQDRARIDTHPLTQAVKRYASFRYNIIPEPVLAENLADAARWCAGAVQQCSAVRARQMGADLLFLCGSGVYSDETLSLAYDFIAEGTGIVACAMPRTQEKQPYEALGRYATVENGILTCDAPSLARFVIENLHAHSKACFIGAGATSVSQNPVALFFRSDDGFVIRTYQPSPLIIANRMLNSIFDVDYFTIDVRFISELLAGHRADTEIFAVNDSANGIVVTDVDCEDGASMRAYEEIALTADTCAKGAIFTATRQEDLAYFQWSLSQRFVFKSSGKLDMLPQNSGRELATIERVFEVVARESAPAQARIATFERLPD